MNEKQTNHTVDCKICINCTVNKPHKCIKCGLEVDENQTLCYVCYVEYYESHNKENR